MKPTFASHSPPAAHCGHFVSRSKHAASESGRLGNVQGQSELKTSRDIIREEPCVKRQLREEAVPAA